MEITKKYTNGEITIQWKSHLCIHCGHCAKGLPEVFQPRQQPWINPLGAETDRIVLQVDECPSGAISIQQSE